MIKLTISSLLICLLTSNVAISQDKTFNKYIENGIALHDGGQYKQALKQYEKALEINENSTLAHFEIAYAYIELKDTKTALKHIELAFKGDTPDRYPMLYAMKGNVLDDMGKTKKAIKTYEKGIDKHPNVPMLHFNLGITHMREGDTQAAQNAFITTISKDYTYPSAHYYLGKLMDEQDERVPAMLAYYFFLLLEPETIRADEVYDRLLLLSSGDAAKTGNNKALLNLNISNMDSPFAPIELFLSLQSSKNLKDEDYQKKDTGEQLISNTKSFFNIMAEMKKDNRGIWWDFYTPYFTHIVECEVITVFCHHIGLSKGGDIALWMEAHEEEAIDFVNCVNEYGN